MIDEIYERDGIHITLKNTVHEKYVVNGNRGRFQQILMNLIANAKDATKGKKLRTINVSVRNENDKLIIEIADNGCGIPDSLKEKIFDPFFTTKDVNEGTGIGLSLVYNFIKEMKGTLSIDSKENEGTVFKIEIPVTVLSPAQVQGQLKVQSQIQVKFDASVILADDEEEIRGLLTDILEDMGFEVAAVENGKKAFELYLGDPDKFDLVISDMAMPEMDGPTLLKNLRERVDIKQPKFIFITGGTNIDFSDDNKLKKYIDGHIFKPFYENEIIETLAQCLGDKIMKDNN